MHLCVYIDACCLANQHILTNNVENVAQSSSPNVHYTRFGWRYEEYFMFLSFFKHLDSNLLSRLKLSDAPF